MRMTGAVALRCSRKDINMTHPTRKLGWLSALAVSALPAVASAAAHSGSGGHVSGAPRVVYEPPVVYFRAAPPVVFGYGFGRAYHAPIHRHYYSETRYRYGR